jgi:glycerophosphoryl diester phosphodiesterase
VPKSARAWDDAGVTLRALLAVAIAGVSAAAHAGEPAFSCFAHRGGIVRGIPENTLAAFRRALALGAHGVELDVRRSADGALVVMHDDTVQRTTNGRGLVARLTLAQLRALDAGNGERVPTFAEAFAQLAHTAVLADIKTRDVPLADLVHVASARGAGHALILGLRDLDALREANALTPRPRTLGFPEEAHDAEAFARAGAVAVRLEPAWLRRDAQLAQRVRALGSEAWALMGDAPRDAIEQMKRLGVTGVLTDRPELCAAAKP